VYRSRPELPKDYETRPFFVVSTITIKRSKVIALTAITGLDVDFGFRAFGTSRGRVPHDVHRAR
jgi:hypothetical protein